MIRVTIKIDKNGCLKQMTATGHAGLAAKGTDILCAAVSALTRTAAKLLYAKETVRVKGGAPEPGRLELEILSYDKTESQWLRGITDFCVSGLNDLRQEYPAYLAVVTEKAGKED